MNDSKEERKLASNDPETKWAEDFKRDQIEKESGGRSDREEYAAEIAPPAAISRPEVRKSADIKEYSDTESSPAVGAQSFRWLGYTALLFSLASLFIYPALLGTTAVLIGILAYSLGFRALGAWSVVIGLISLAGYLFLVPMYA